MFPAPAAAGIVVDDDTASMEEGQMAEAPGDAGAGDAGEVRDDAGAPQGDQGTPPPDKKPAAKKPAAGRAAKRRKPAAKAAGGGATGGAKKAAAGGSRSSGKTSGAGGATPRRSPAAGRAKKPAAQDAESAATAAETAATTGVTAAPDAKTAATAVAPALGAAGSASDAAAGDAAPTAGPHAAQPRAHRVRAWVALALVILSILAIVVSTVSLWSRSIVFDTNSYLRVVAPVASDPAVRDTVSAYVAGQAIAVTDLSTRIENALPSDAKVLAGPLTVTLQRYLADEIAHFLATPVAQRLWVDINRFAHEQLITALQDKNRYVTVGKDDVKLNLLPLVAVALQRLEAQIPRLLGRDVQLPQIDPATAPEAIRTLLQDALGRQLPADFGSVTLLRGGQGYEAKRALRLFNDAVVVIVLLTVALVAAALAVSPRRLRTALQLGLGALLGFAVARVVEIQLEQAIVRAVKSQGGLAVARAIVDSAVASLNGFFVWIAVAGVVVAVAAFLAARPAWLEAMGRGFAKLFGVSSDLSAPDTRAGRWIGDHLDVLRVAGVGVAVVALLFAVRSLSAVLVIVAALAVFELALTAYAVGLPPAPGGEPPDAPG